MLRDRLAKTFQFNDLSMGNFPADHTLRPLACVVRQRYRYSQLLLLDILMLHKRVANGMETMLLESQEPGASIAKPNLLYHYKLHSECWVYQMRRTLDALVQFVEILRHANVSAPPVKLESTGISSLLSEGCTCRKAYPIVMGDDACFSKDNTRFIKTLNDLFNGMKHHWIHEESHNRFCKEWPTIVSFYAKNNDLSQGVVYHNHNAYHLAMGFQDNVARILSNVRKSLDTDR